MVYEMMLQPTEPPGQGLALHFKALTLLPLHGGVGEGLWVTQGESLGNTPIFVDARVEALSSTK